MSFTLPKSEILRGFKSFTRIITSGKSIAAPPIRCYYIRSIQNPRQILAGFSVSRNIRRAVDRNRAKRLMRESYRLNKSLLNGEQKMKSLDMVFMYTGPASSLRGKSSFRESNRSMLRLLALIAEEGD